MLVEQFGYDQSCTKLLLGAAATQKTIDNHLKDILCNEKEVNKQDSVLFFFAGHGRRRHTADKINYIGEILPWDVREKDRDVEKSSVLALDQIEQNGEGGGGSICDVGVEQSRQFIEAFGSLGGTVEVARVEDLTIPGPGGDIPARLYSPAEEAVLPVVVYFHGGGWCIGNHVAREEVGRKLRMRRDLSGIANAHEGGDARELGDATPIVFDALEQLAIEEHNGRPRRIERRRLR